jgi:succinate dehydrogenase / fumarate reductase cytochrome b subunit
VVASFQRWPVAVVYIVANLALALHLYHGAWSLFQSMGWSGRRLNKWRRYFAIAVAVLVALGNVSFPVAVLTGIVS